MVSFALYCMLFGVLIFFPETDGGSLTWNEPPPTQIVQAVITNPVNHFSSRQLFEGTINATFSWHFGLTDLIFDFLIILFEGDSVARVSPSLTRIRPSYANRFGLDWIPNKNLVKLFIFNVTTEDNGTFSCRVAADSLDRFSDFRFTSNIQVDVVAPPRSIIISRDQNVTAPVELTLNCSAVGKPDPNITWTRLSDNTVVTMPLIITGEKDGGSYRCTADNGVGKRLIKDVFVDVQVPPMVTLASKVFVGREQTASLICEVEGNPAPIISWSPCYGQSVVCDKQYLNISKVQTARANYTCKATNTVGVDSATTLLLIGGKNVYLRLSVSGNCDNKDSVWEILKEELGNVFTNTQGYSGAEMIVVRCGSLIFDVVLKFGIKVAEDDTISIIQNAIVDGKLGELSVNVSHTIGIPAVEQTTVTVPTSTTPKSDGLFQIHIDSSNINSACCSVQLLFKLDSCHYLVKMDRNVNDM
ncbi:lachesin-like isoform X4 [Acropora millepora]|uniref:lachesin-like isoform X4 n=1 Tax=Acropora millepora TaxID=45264 RepID=UPI001CF582A8|nr:lachesin-like isoform X4 [Acropora millepora]